MPPEQRQESLTLTDSPVPPAAVRQSPGFDWFDARGFLVLGWTLTSAYVLLEVLAGFARQLGAFDDCIPLISAALIIVATSRLLISTTYTPLLDYLYAIAFRMLGHAVIVPWILSSILYIAVTIRAARFLRQRVPLFGLLGPLMTLLAAVSLVNVSRLPMWPAYAFSLLAVFSYSGENSDSPPTNPRLSTQNRPSVITSKPANESHSGPNDVYRVGRRSGKYFLSLNGSSREPQGDRARGISA